MSSLMGRSAMGHFQRGNQGARLIDRLLILARGHRIRDQTRTRLHAGQAFLHHHGANGDAGVEIAGKIQIENRAGVDAATRGFELVDDFHGANLGRTGDSSAREAGGESVEAIDVGAQTAAQARYQVHDMGVALDHHELRHLDRADLGRNDLGRVSEYGTVRVEKLMFVERYSHVMHLVSSLRGRLREEVDCFDALAACFPGGTLSGAPKVRAMEIIDELEPTRRGIYGGAILYLDFSGNLDSCIAIRTMVVKKGVAYVQAGAGLVADSVPETEYTETVNKARALLTALEIAHRGDDPAPGGFKTKHRNK